MISLSYISGVVGDLLLTIFATPAHTQNMPSTTETAQTGRRVYELPAQVEEGAVKRIAVLFADSRLVPVTMGGVVRIKGRIFGLTAFPISDSDVSRNPPPQSYRILGHIDEQNVHEEWALIRLDSPMKMQNIIRIPDGFGESFVPTKFASDLKPSSVVWVATGKGVVTGRSGLVTGETWEVTLTDGANLGTMRTFIYTTFCL